MQQENKRRAGSVYEKAVGYYLEQQGYQILEYNYHIRTGEIDLIAKDGCYLVFIEVKYRKGSGNGGALAAVTPRKQRRIYQCALHYLTIHGCVDAPCRFDVIGIEAGKIIHIKDAFCG